MWGKTGADIRAYRRTEKGDQAYKVIHSTVHTNTYTVFAQGHNMNIKDYAGTARSTSGGRVSSFRTFLRKLVRRELNTLPPVDRGTGVSEEDERGSTAGARSCSTSLPSPSS